MNSSFSRSTAGVPARVPALVWRPAVGAPAAAAAPGAAPDRARRAPERRPRGSGATRAVPIPAFGVGRSSRT